MADATINTISTHELKKSISIWIVSLQGTGNSELNRVVNELHSLEYHIANPGGDNQDLRSSVRNLLRQVRTIKDRQSDPYHRHLLDVEKQLRNLSL